MRKFLSSLCLRVSRRSKRTDFESTTLQIQPDHPQKKAEMTLDPQTSQEENIILNHDFSEGTNSWHPNCCEVHTASRDSGLFHGITPFSGEKYAVVTKRTESWQGLEQDITGGAYLDATYYVSAFVRVHGDLQGPTGIQATLKLEYPDSHVEYLFIGRISASKESWERLEGSFSLTSLPKHIVFYLEGPPSGVDLLIDSVTISCTSPKQLKEVRSSITVGDGNIIINPQFEDGLNKWSGRGCKIFLHNASERGNLKHVDAFASTANRSQSWNGIEHEITGRVKRKLPYEVHAVVRIAGSTPTADVRLTLWAQSPNGREQYIGIGSGHASNKEWMELKGKFLLNGITSKAIIYIEGPPPGVDIHVCSLVVKRAVKLPPSSPPGFGETKLNSITAISTNIISNHDFSQGLQSWMANCCDAYVVSGDSGCYNGVTARTGAAYAVITNRTELWQGLMQNITGKVAPGFIYNLIAYVRIGGGHQETAEVMGTLKLEFADAHVRYIHTGRALVSSNAWEKLEGSFKLDDMPACTIFYLEGSPSGHDLLVDSVIVSLSTDQQFGSALYGVNIIENSTLKDGLKHWSPLGSCTLSVQNGSPQLFPPVARESLGDHKTLSGRYVLAKNRTETWMGPSQTVTEKIKLHMIYQVSAWVRVGSGAKGAQNINLALNVDNQWINGGQTEVDDDKWHELSGSFRIEKEANKIVVYVQGPSPGVDLMVAGLHIFAVDRKARFEFLKKQTEKIRKCDVILRLPDYLFGSHVKITQTENSFPFGCCINRSNIENEEFVDFFVKNFNWAVFGNELKWYHTEAERGKLKYRDADEMLHFCERHNMKTRGHCIFWEVEDAVQPWIRSLKERDLMSSVDHRLTSLLTRYKGRFKHYDVNNEMLHGSFYQDRLGNDIRAYMFRKAHELDPFAKLFVNDYHVEDGCDSKSSPEKYINQILELQEQGAPIHGIGIQGHIDHPVGPVVRSALDKLAILGIPIWFTELDVCAINEHVRADDLEVILREAYAHPLVEGIVLWGFWEMFMCRDYSHLVDADGEVNEAGKRYLNLKEEWLSHADGNVDSNGEFKFRGYEGKYTVEVVTPEQKKITRSVVVSRGDDPVVLTIT